jgi:hypothetical protein
MYQFIPKTYAIDLTTKRVGGIVSSTGRRTLGGIEAEGQPGYICSDITHKIRNIT